jgi:uncharacterized protein YPO0396
MNPALLQQPFFQVTLPLMVTIVAALWAATWSQNKKVDEMGKRIDGRIDEMAKRIDGRIDEMAKRLDGKIDSLIIEMNRRFDEIVARLTRIEAKLENHDERIVRLEERTSPLARH